VQGGHGLIIIPFEASSECITPGDQLSDSRTSFTKSTVLVWYSLRRPSAASITALQASA
jgi:hypothetical protein